MTSAETRHPHGWFKAGRSPVAGELIRANPNAFILLYVIASRARWQEGFNAHGLEQGEAFVGDHDAIGMSERQYRTAKALLGKNGFATFKATNKGTVAKLCNSEVFDIAPTRDDEQNDGQATDARRTPDGQATDARRTPDGQATDARRTPDGQATDARRTPDGQATDARRLSKKERRKEGEQERREDIPLPASPPVSDGEPISEAIPKKTLRMQKARPLLHYLNEKAGRSFRETETNLLLIAARLEEVHGDAQGCKQMIERKCAQWKDDQRMAEFLRPETLFGKQKFGGYYDTRELPAAISSPSPRHATVADTRNQFIAGANDPTYEAARLEAGRLAEERGFPAAVVPETPEDERPLLPGQGDFAALRAAIEG